jgi:hypothetical protein
MSTRISTWLTSRTCAKPRPIGVRPGRWFATWTSTTPTWRQGRPATRATTSLIDAIAGPFEIDWQQEDLESVRHTLLKRYNAEIHSQSAIEALLELRAVQGLPHTVDGLGRRRD